MSRRSGRIAVLVSGSGRSLENLAEQVSSGELEAQIGLVISSRAGVQALERARRLEIEFLVVDPERELNAEEYSRRLFAECASRAIELVVLAGFLRLLVIPAAWERRVLNIHPSLLPAFGGKGYYGERVHRAVLERGVQFTGCTVHYVTNEYDAGPILLQRCTEVRADDTIETLAARVFEEEKRALPEAIRRHFADQPGREGDRDSDRAPSTGH